MLQEYFIKKSFTLKFVACKYISLYIAYVNIYKLESLENLKIYLELLALTVSILWLNTSCPKLVYCGMFGTLKLYKAQLVRIESSNYLPTSQRCLVWVTYCLVFKILKQVWRQVKIKTQLKNKPNNKTHKNRRKKRKMEIYFMLHVEYKNEKCIWQILRRCWEELSN
jgi:hypothetical protein